MTSVSSFIAGPPVWAHAERFTYQPLRIEGADGSHPENITVERAEHHGTQWWFAKCPRCYAQAAFRDDEANREKFGDLRRAAVHALASLRQCNKPAVR